jgi:hypothetical protein
MHWYGGGLLTIITYQMVANPLPPPGDEILTDNVLEVLLDNDSVVLTE